MENSLLNARCAHLSLTGSELFDNVIFAVALQVTTYSARDILARLVYMQPRVWLTSKKPAESLSYHAQARMAIHDNFTRRIWRGSGFTVSPGRPGRYSHPNRIQFALVLVAAGAGFLCDIAGTSLGLPTSHAQMVRTDKIMNWRSVMLTEGRLAPSDLTMRGYPCETTPVRDGPNLRSRANWIRCSMFQFIPQMNKTVLQNSTNLDTGPFFLMLTRVEYFTHGIQMLLVNAHGLVTVHYSSAIVHDETFLGHMTFNNSTEDYVRHFITNARLLQNRTGLILHQLTSATKKRLDELANGTILENNIIFFEIDARNVKWPSQIPPDLRGGFFRLSYVSYTFDSIMRGIFEYRGEGSKLYEVDFNETSRQLGQGGFYVNALNATFAPAIRSIGIKQIEVANYSGTVLPVVDALKLTACILLFYIVVRLCLKDPPGLGWEVITAHGRKCSDKLLSGPDAKIELTQSRRISRSSDCYAGYGVPAGFHPVAGSFAKHDIIEASPLNSPVEGFEEDVSWARKTAYAIN